jgi:hypothetical protein
MCFVPLPRLQVFAVRKEESPQFGREFYRCPIENKGIADEKRGKDEEKRGDVANGNTTKPTKAKGLWGKLKKKVAKKDEEKKGEDNDTEPEAGGPTRCAFFCWVDRAPRGPHLAEEVRRRNYRSPFVQLHTHFQASDFVAEQDLLAFLLEGSDAHGGKRYSELALVIPGKALDVLKCARHLLDHVMPRCLSMCPGKDFDLCYPESRVGMRGAMGVPFPYTGALAAPMPYPPGTDWPIVPSFDDADVTTTLTAMEWYRRGLGQDEIVAVLHSFRRAAAPQVGAYNDRVASKLFHALVVSSGLCPAKRSQCAETPAAAATGEARTPMPCASVGPEKTGSMSEEVKDSVSVKTKADHVHVESKESGNIGKDGKDDKDEASIVSMEAKDAKEADHTNSEAKGVADDVTAAVAASTDDDAGGSVAEEPERHQRTPFLDMFDKEDGRESPSLVSLWKWLRYHPSLVNHLLSRCVFPSYPNLASDAPFFVGDGTESPSIKRPALAVASSGVDVAGGLIFGGRRLALCGEEVPADGVEDLRAMFPGDASDSSQSQRSLSGGDSGNSSHRMVAASSLTGSDGDGNRNDGNGGVAGAGAGGIGAGDSGEGRGYEEAAAIAWPLHSRITIVEDAAVLDVCRAAFAAFYGGGEGDMENREGGGDAHCACRGLVDLGGWMRSVPTNKVVAALTILLRSGAGDVTEQPHQQQQQQQQKGGGRAGESSAVVVPPVASVVYFDHECSRWMVYSVDTRLSGPLMPGTISRASCFTYVDHMCARASPGGAGPGGDPLPLDIKLPVVSPAIAVTLCKETTTRQFVRVLATLGTLPYKPHVACMVSPTLAASLGKKGVGDIRRSGDFSGGKGVSACENAGGRDGSGSEDIGGGGGSCVDSIGEPTSAVSELLRLMHQWGRVRGPTISGTRTVMADDNAGGSRSEKSMPLQVLCSQEFGDLKSACTDALLSLLQQGNGAASESVIGPQCDVEGKHGGKEGEQGGEVGRGHGITAEEKREVVEAAAEIKGESSASQWGDGEAALGWTMAA